MTKLVKTVERHDPAIGEGDRVRLFAGPGFLPFVKVVDRHQAAPALERLAKSRLALDPFRLGVDVGEADLDVFGLIRDQAPAQHVETALLRLRIVANDGQRIGRRRVPAGRKIRDRPLGRNPEHELDFAHIGGEADASTHSGKDSAGRVSPQGEGGIGRDGALTRVLVECRTVECR